MFDFRLFPGTNFNRINLDWILAELGILKEGQDTVEEAAEQATEAATEATQAAVDASQAAADAIAAIDTVTARADEAVATAESAVSDAAAAQSAADDATTAAATAQSTANNAQSAAATAQSAATTAQGAAATAQSAATTAQNTATAAQSAATANAALIAAFGTPHTWTNPDNSNEKWTWWEIGKLRVAFGENSLSYEPTSTAGTLFRTPGAVVYGNAPFVFTSGVAAVGATQVQWPCNQAVDVAAQQLTAYFLATNSGARTPAVRFIFIALAP